VKVQDRVLLVEDEASLRRSLEIFLGRAGYTCESCSTAREALALAERIDPHIAIVEYHLPDGSGARLVDGLKRVVPEVAAILISEYDFQVVAKESAQISVRYFLKKPFDVVDLESALSSARTKQRVTAVDDDEELGCELD
jgi:two-component system, NtrC family, response regulator AtoC